MMRSMRWYTAAAVAAAAGMAMCAQAQTPVQIDVNPYSTTVADASPANFARLGSSVLFSANDGAAGTELWITDGTLAGTTLLLDINPGTGSSSPQNLTSFGSRVIFTADNGTQGRELWITDGTPAGTTLLAEIRSGATGATFSSASGVIGTFGVPGSYVVFGANDGVNGTEPWATDGTTSGTVLLANINNTGANVSSNASGFFSSGTRVYFLANEGATGALTGNELWSTDGTAGGTTRLTDIAPGTPSSAYSLDLIVGNWGYGVANNISIGNDQEPTVINLTTLEVRRLADVRPGATGSSSQEFVNIGGTVYFRASANGTDTQLYRVTNDSMGDPASVALVADLNTTGNDNVGNLASFAGELYFSANDGSNGRELWKLVGANPPALLADLNPGAADSTPGTFLGVGMRLFFSASVPGFGRELFVTDGTALGTQRLSDFRLGNANAISGTTTPSLFVALSNTLLLSASGTSIGIELFKSDGTPTTTTLVRDIRPQTVNNGSVPQSLTAVGSRLYFTATNEVTGRELWTSDGTASGTTLVIDAQPGTTGGAPYAITPFGSNLLFAANGGTGTGQTGIEYYQATGGTAALIADIASGTGSSAPGGSPTIGVLNGVAYFNANDGTTGAELWSFDGTNAPSRVADFNVGSAGFNPASFATLGNFVYFAAGISAAGGFGTELYRTDGAAITLVEDFNATSPTNSNSSSPTGMFAFDGKLFMRATAPSLGSELVVFDPAIPDMYLVQDIRTGSASSSPSNFVNFNNQLFFTATDTGGNIQLYTATATASSAQVKSAAIGSTIPTLVKSGNFLFFNAGSLVGTNVQLWAYDGVAGGGQAFPVTINPSGGAFPTDLTDVGGRLYFAAVGATGGNELYRVTFNGSGVPNGAELVADLNPAGSSTPRNFRVVGTRLYFAADNGVSGEELWYLDTAPANVVCCRGSTCSFIPAASCVTTGFIAGASQPGGGACNVSGNTTSPCCLADYNKSGSVAGDVPDIFAFLQDWFANSPYAFFGGDGTGSGSPGVPAIFAFLAAWFAGCP